MIRLCLGLGQKLELGLGFSRLRDQIGVPAASMELGLGCRLGLGYLWLGLGGDGTLYHRGPN